MSISGAFNRLITFGAAIPSVNDKQNRFKVNERSITLRIIAVAVLLGGIFGRGIQYSPSILLLPAVAPILFKALYSIGHTRAILALHQRAVDLFKEKNNVPEDAIEHLSNNASTVRQLASEQVDLTKCDKNGTSLLSTTFDSSRDSTQTMKERFEIFKILMNHNVPLQTARENYFIKALSVPKYHKYAIYALSHDKIKPADFTPIAISIIWSITSDVEILELLIQKGFSIESKI